MADMPTVDTIALIGLGLIGSSISHACRRANAARVIRGFDLSAETRSIAVEIGLVDHIAASAAEAVAGADLVILCAPPGAMAAIGAEIGPHLKAGAILSDVGSVKAAVACDLGAVTPQAVHLIPGHPIAGTEQSGPRAGFADLFDNRWCILTPPDNADPIAIGQLTAFWQALGSKVEVMDAAHHDLVLAITSHVPHLIAYNIVGTAADLETVTQSEVIKYSAGGFRDFTRIAASDPTMWRDVFLNNREAVLEMLGRFTEDLISLQRAIRWGDGELLFNLFTRTREIRRSIIDAGQDSPAPDFGRHPKKQ
jgi:cyclohexadieny/prephenate dehydrogenase